MKEILLHMIQAGLEDHFEGGHLTATSCLGKAYRLGPAISIGCYSRQIPLTPEIHIPAESRPRLLVKHSLFGDSHAMIFGEWQDMGLVTRAGMSGGDRANEMVLVKVVS